MAQVAYGITLGIYDQQSVSYKAGCSVTSIASSSRRNSYAITFTAVASSAEAATAENAATQLSTDVSSLSHNIAAAQMATSSSAVIPTPQAATPPEVVAAPSEEETGDDGLLYIIVGALICIGGAVGVGCSHYCCKKGGDTPQTQAMEEAPLPPLFRNVQEPHHVQAYAMEQDRGRASSLHGAVPGSFPPPPPAGPPPSLGFGGAPPPPPSYFSDSKEDEFSKVDDQFRSGNSI